MSIFLTPIFTAVRQAAALCQLVQQKYIVADQQSSIAEKLDAEPVTLADYGSQALICRAISQTFPDDGVIAEEGAQQFRELILETHQQEVAQLIGTILQTSVTVEDVITWLDYGQNRDEKRQWVIDPIDGTKGFIALRNYAIAIGLLNQGKPVAGVMGTPGYAAIDGGAIFYAQDSKVYRESLKGGTAQAIVPSQRTDPASLIFVESVEKSHASHDTMAEVREMAGMESAQVHRLDSQEKYCLVACGDADVYLRLPRSGSTYQHRIWDHAAGVAIVEAAGGIVSDVDGSVLDFSQGSTLARNKGMVVANPLIHSKLVEATSKINF